jgi:hypothetical protein
LYAVVHRANASTGVIEAAEDRLIEQFVTHAAVERLADAVLQRFSGAMKCQAVRLLCAQASTAHPHFPDEVKDCAARSTTFICNRSK